MSTSPDDGAAYAGRVSALIEDLELQLLRAIAAELRAGSDATWEQTALAGLQRWRQAAARGVAGAEQGLLQVILEVMLAARDDGVTSAAADLNEAGISRGRPRPAGATVRQAEQLAAQVMATLQQTPRLLTSVYQQAVTAGAGEVLGGKVTRLQAAQHVLDRLLVRGITGFRDSSGRNWALTSYVEMAVRTATGHAAIDGHTQTLEAAGMDLVVVSDSPRECPGCRPWEGKVLSLSGRVGTTLVPSATGLQAVRVEVAGSLSRARSAGLFHPNCTHRLTGLIPGVSRPRPVADPAGYAAKQRQRDLERHVREWKRREAVALDDGAAARARAKTREWQRALREHVDANGLKRLRRREQIGVAT
ncbi:MULTISPECIES: phage minor capsid protein [unclassified Nocardioides]|uniref:phage minor capsid protein n=1 Tax=unclassified Nocardioides TaxID=2615069 RepID=UPI0009F0FCB7|nr:MULTISPECIES: phage minor capsid protein [unclassified Nocardioides]GAW50606.1 Phage protein [Nocardioides sp. PD653-B2]GAW57584.1 Phage protein [Nocardioides sp. PD653]